MSLGPVVSLRDIARRVGVSHAAVSKALRDDPEISVARRAQIHAVAQEMGYRPDPFLQQLANYRRSRRGSRIESCIAWLNDWSKPEDYYRYPQYAGYWKGAEAATAALGFRLEEIRTRKVAPTSERLRRVLLARGIRGVLIPPHRDEFQHRTLDWNGFSVVKIGFSISGLATHLVTSDQYGGGRIAAERLLEAGHTRIGFVSTRALEQHTRGNFSAALLHTRDRAVAVKERIPPLFLDGESDMTDRKAFVAWVRENQPTAVLYSPNAVAMWRESLPAKQRDVVFCSISRIDAPAESGLNQLPEEVGRAAAELLVSQINAHNFGIPAHPRRVLIEPQWEGATQAAPSHARSVPKRRKN
jgi:LacI family transcriptional regulator